MPKMLTQKEFSTMVCTVCKCNNSKMHLNQKCHPGAGVKLIYYADGFLEAICMECGELVSQIAVAEGE